MKIRLRQDLLFFQRDDPSGASWVVKDPVTFEHYLFSDKEVFLLKQLDGSRTETEIIQRWRAHFRTALMSVEQLRQFVKRLVGDNLVIVDQFGYGRFTLGQQQRIQSAARGSWITNPLAIRFRGVNPTGVLRYFDWIGWLMFHPVVVTASLLIEFVLLCYFFGHFETVAERIPAIEYFLNTRGLIGIALSIAGIKVLHELGHALACRRYGGECFEIGLLLLAFLPTLYCNVSDSWTFGSRWKRMMVSFAGMYVELGLATLAAVGWWLTPPGLANALLFNVVVICTVNTLLVNGNPLLRYDGYYLLSDGWGKPNLAGSANRVTMNFWLARFLKPGMGIRTPSDLLMYGLMSWAYRWMIVALILAAIIWGIGAMGSFAIGYAVSGVLLFGILISGMARTFRYGSSDAWHGISILRSSISIAVMILMLWFVFYIPLPSYVYCDIAVEPRNPVRAYAPADGKLIMIQSNFARVQPGDVIAQLSNRRLARQRQRKQSELAHQQNQMRQLELRLNGEPELASAIRSLSRKSTTLASEVELLNREIEDLTLSATTQGIVLPSDIAFGRLQSDPSREPWRGHLNEARNLGCYVSRGEHLLTICDPRKLTISAAVRETEMDLVEQSQVVLIRFEQFPGATSVGSIAKILKQELPLNQRKPDSIIESYADSTGQTRFVQAPFRIEINVSQVPENVLLGSTGRAKISVRSQTVAERIHRWIGSTLANP